MRVKSSLSLIWPVRKFQELTFASAATMRSTNCWVDISSEKIPHGFVLDCGLARDVERERRFTHRGARSQNDKVRLLEAGEHVVELFKAGAHAAQLVFVLVEVLKPCPCVLERLAQRGKFREGRGRGDLVDFFLGFVERLLELFASS
jgi:hypothetical protein